MTEAKRVARRHSAGRRRDGKNGTVREQTDLAYLAPDRPQWKEGTATNLLRAHEGQSRKRTCEQTYGVRGRGRRGGRWGRCAGRWRAVGSRRGL